MEVKPGYKQTEVGVIPEEWRVSTVGHEFEIKLGKMLDAEKNVGVPKPYLGNKAVQWDRIDISDLPTVPMSRADIERFRLQKGDLLVCEGGEVGRAAIWDAPIDECYYQKALHRLRPLHGYDSRLMVALLRQWSNQGRLLNYVTQTSIAHLPREKFVEVPMPVPPLPEQRAIAAALGDVDALIGGLDKLIAKKRDLKQAAMQQLLTGKQRLPGFKGEWETYTFGELFDILRSASNSRSDLDEHSEVGYLHYGDIHTHPSAFLDCASELRTFIASSKVGSTPPMTDGDLVMVDASEDTMAIGKAVEIRGLNGRKAIAGLHTFLLRSKKDLLAKGFKGYLQYFQSVRSALVRLATGVSVYGVTKSGVKTIEVTIPKPDEQTAIATVLSDMDAEIAALETRRDKTRALKQGMMQELLTGKTRLV